MMLNPLCTSILRASTAAEISLVRCIHIQPSRLINFRRLAPWHFWCLGVQCSKKNLPLLSLFFDQKTALKRSTVVNAWRYRRSARPHDKRISVFLLGITYQTTHRCLEKRWTWIASRWSAQALPVRCFQIRAIFYVSRTLEFLFWSANAKIESQDHLQYFYSQ